MNIRTVVESPTVDEYLKSLTIEESSREFHTVRAGKLKLTSGGVLQADEHVFEVREQARKDLAKLAQIPVTYFEDVDPELRATNFNGRLPQFLGREEALELTISNDNAVDRVQRPRLGQVRASQAVGVLMEAAPAATISSDIRVVEYGREGCLDLALVAQGLQVEPREGDTVYGGVHLSIEENGAVQVGPETFRLVCLNGAMARVCPGGGQHRLRRGQGQNSERNFIATLRDFGRRAWGDWEHVRKGLERLTQESLDREDIGQIIQGLRQSPFFISGRVAGRVENELRRNSESLSFYDLHNAITYVGTHDVEVLPQYRHRLRLGAGQLARGRVGVCQECRRLMIGAGISRN